MGNVEVEAMLNAVNIMDSQSEVISDLTEKLAKARAAIKKQQDQIDAGYTRLENELEAANTKLLCYSNYEHASDCAVHNMPAYPNGDCDCGALVSARETIKKQNDALEAVRIIRNAIAELNDPPSCVGFNTLRLLDEALDKAEVKP